MRLDGKEAGHTDSPPPMLHSEAGLVDSMVHSVDPSYHAVLWGLPKGL